VSVLQLRRSLTAAARRARPLLQHWHDVRRWRLRGRQGTLPARFKHEVLRQYARDFGISRFVESGTYRGETVAALQDDFGGLISVELDDTLYEAARRRFDGVDHVEILQGDSGQLMPRIVERIDAPTLFWLDGHYSAGVTARGVEETPVLRELDAVLGPGQRGHVALVDDARCFTGDGGWPSIDELRDRVRELDPELEFDVIDDIIRIHAVRQVPSPSG
jgi:hypothetical protein